MQQFREVPQYAFEEVDLRGDAALEAALESLVRTREAASANRRAKREIRKLLEGRPPGRYRCGPFVIERQPLEGGGYEVPEWHTMVNRITAIE